MNLKPIEGYEGLYSFDFNTNQVYSHYKKKYKKFNIVRGYYSIALLKNNKLKTFQSHRLIYEANFGTIPNGLYIDHIDNNKLNNNIDNLRLCTYSQNLMNRKTQKNNLSTGYKNISKTKNNTYVVKIAKNKQVVYRKNFKTLEEAIINRDIKLKEIHGDFCNLG